jgi:hypothetical protein
MTTTFAFPDASLTRAQRLARLDAFATLLDAAFVVPGTNVRLGLDAILGLVPGIGDTISTLMALWILREAHVLGAPRRVLLRMAGNIAIDTMAGAVPVIGDLADVAIRANLRNVRLLRDHLAGEARAGR